jgi:alpha-tubulin suppressor-like RCC1 family protein
MTTRSLLASTMLLLLAAGCDDPLKPDSARAYIALVTGGDHSCAIAEGGSAFCWGRGADGQLGTGSKINEFQPAGVQGELSFSEITAGDAHTCAVATDGQAYCWGWNGFFQRGNPTNTADAVPVPVATTLRFRHIAAGAHHSCALTLDSLAYCWGLNRHGQLGDGSTDIAISPRAVSGGRKFNSISAGAFHTCAVTAAGSAYCWGSNESGQLGIGTNALIASAPVAVLSSVRFTQVDGGASHTCGVGTSSQLYCWGSSEYGELGDGGVFRSGLPGVLVPAPVSFLFPTGVSISAGNAHTCAVGALGRSACWGRGQFGQLGNGTITDQYQPQPLQIFAQALPVTSFAAGGISHACALVERAVYCWGTGENGELGAQDSRFSGLPQRVRD